MTRWTCRLRSLNWPRPWLQCRHLQATALDVDISKIRNIGIVAHIDAGKTTTTERMLYYAGYTKSLGDVDSGSTVMDYLPEERERGITINSAAITFPWQRHRINLIDTPGHADFTFEVERSVRVLDAAVCLLDAVKGVEAQTEKVWRQTHTLNPLPSIVFVNKMDRVGAGFGRAVHEAASKLGARTAVLQLPWYVDRGKDFVAEGDVQGEHFAGVIDVLSRVLIVWEGDGRETRTAPVSALPAHVQKHVDTATTALVESLAEVDEELLDTYLDLEDALRVPAQQVVTALARATKKALATPVLMGSAARNIGVQPLLDAVLTYLPSPLERPPPVLASSSSPGEHVLTDQKTPIALAFKVVYDTQRGPLVYARVYAGVLRPGMTLRNTTLGTTERVTRVMYAFADDFYEVPHVSAGNTCVLVGTKGIRTGDTLVASRGAAGSDVELLPIRVPPPVFASSVEPNSPAEQRGLELALERLVQEDPSFTVTRDDTTGQVLLGGMGELHLDIGASRLLRHFRARATMGPLEISYKESIREEACMKHDYAQTVAGRDLAVALEVCLRPLSLAASPARGNVITAIGDNQLVYKSSLPTRIGTACGLGSDEVRMCLEQGTQAGLVRGRIQGLPIIDVQVELCNVEALPDKTNAHALMAGVRQAVAQVVRNMSPDDCVIMQPVMDVVITVDAAHVGAVVNDVSGVRHGEVYETGAVSDVAVSGGMHAAYAPPDNTYHGLAETAGPLQVVRARVPLVGMVGYNRVLQSLTGGRGSFTQTLNRFEPVRRS